MSPGAFLVGHDLESLTPEGVSYSWR